MEGFRTVIIITYLGMVSCFDIKYKKIPIWILCLGEILGLILFLFGWQKFEITFLVPMVPGILLMLIGLISKGQIGSGDGLCMLVLGTMMNFKECIVVFCIGLFSISLFSLFLLAIKKVNKNTQIPFIPFLFLGESLYLFLNYN